MLTFFLLFLLLPDVLWHVKFYLAFLFSLMKVGKWKAWRVSFDKDKKLRLSAKSLHISFGVCC